MPWVTSYVGDNPVTQWMDEPPSPAMLGTPEAFSGVDTSWMSAEHLGWMQPQDVIGILGGLPSNAKSFGNGVFGVWDKDKYRYFDAGGNPLEQNSQGAFGYYTPGRELWTSDLGAGMAGNEQIWNPVSGSRGDSARLAWGSTPQERYNNWVRMTQQGMDENPFTSPEFALALAAIGGLTGGFGLLGNAGNTVGLSGGASMDAAIANGAAAAGTGAAAAAGGSGMFDIADLMSGLGDTFDYTDVLGDWATTAGTGGATSLPSSWLSDLAASDFADFGVTGVESLGDALNYATGAADGTFGISNATQAADFLRSLGMDTNTALQTVGMFTQAGMSPANIAKTVGRVTGLVNDDGTLTAKALGTGLNAGAGLLQMMKSQDAAGKTALAQVEAARIAADAAKFRPVGVTTRFGQSQFGYDANGNLTTAGYNLSPEMKALQDQLMGATPGMLNQFTGSMAATAPMGTAAQSAMQLGQGYLGTDPAAQAAKYMAEQQALLAPTREREFVNLENRLRAQGRLGLATGATESGLAAANPELEAFYNAKRMQDLQLAANATQGGMDYAKFGAGLVGTGGDLLKNMYGTQTAAYSPYQTALGGAQTLEGMGQSAMDIGTSLGSKTSTAAANAGNITAQGMINSAQTNQAAAYSPWAALLAGAGNTIGSYAQPTLQPGMLSYDPTKQRVVSI